MTTQLSLLTAVLPGREDPLRAYLSALRETIRAAGTEGRKLRPLEVQITTAGGVVTATVRYRNTTDVALVGVLLPDVTLSASVAMALEPP